MEYKEKFKEAKKLYETANADQKYVLESLFPELAESEDERIRLGLINAFEEFLRQNDYDKETNFKGVNTKDAIAWLEKQGEQKPYASETMDEKGNFDNGFTRMMEKEQNPIINVPSREVILSIWDLGNEWKELTNGIISTEYGTQLDYIQKHWQESEYYLRAKQGEKKSNHVLDIEIPFGMNDSELIEETIMIPEGYSARIKGNKIIIKKNN